MSRLPRFALDHEERANRFLDSMGAIQMLLGQQVPGAQIDAEKMAHLFWLLNDEAEIVVTPFRPGAANDEGDDGP